VSTPAHVPAPVTASVNIVISGRPTPVLLLIRSRPHPYSFYTFRSEYFSFFKYGFSALSIVIWDGVDIPCEAGEKCLFESGAEVLDYLNLPPSNLVRDLAVLAGMVIGFRVFAYFFLILGMRTKANE